MRRLLAILIVALLAAPGLWWRSPPPPVPDRPMPDAWRLTLEPLALSSRDAGEAEIAGTWALESDYPGFGSYSAMVSLGDGRMLAASDTGRMLEFALPGGRPAPPRMDSFAGRWQPNKFLVDIEGLTRDPASGRIWAAYEGSNAIERFEGDFGQARRIRPMAMRGWSGNSGPESLLRLADGRFLVISEGRTSWGRGRHPALLFPSDPVDGGEPLRFEFEGPGGFRPVDAAQLPDGRVLVLMRRFDWLPPGFRSRLLVADPAEIRADGSWNGREIATLAAPLPTENYEGMVVRPAADGSVRIWLIADDNNSALQRTLLLELKWNPGREKARGNPARPVDSR